MSAFATEHISAPPGMRHSRTGDVRVIDGIEQVCTRSNQSAAYWIPTKTERVPVTRGGKTFMATVKNEPTRTTPNFERQTPVLRRLSDEELIALVENKQQRKTVTMITLELGHVIGWALEPIVNEVTGELPDGREQVEGKPLRWTVVAVDDRFARIATTEDPATKGLKTTVIERRINEYYLVQKPAPREIERKSNLEAFLVAHAAAAGELTTTISSEEKDNSMATKTKSKKNNSAKAGKSKGPRHGRLGGLLGFSVTSVLVTLGKNGVTVPHAKAILKANKAKASDASVSIFVTAGAQGKGKRGPGADLTKEQIKTLIASAPAPEPEKETAAAA